MPLIQFVITLAIVGGLLWLFNTYVTMIDPTIKRIINIAVVVAVVLWCLSVFGVLGDANTMRIPRL